MFVTVLKESLLVTSVDVPGISAARYAFSLELHLLSVFIANSCV
jgi:hypothetical protein